MSDGRAVRGVDSCNSQILQSRVRVRITARADTCLGWDAWHHPVIRATRRPFRWANFMRSNTPPVYQLGRECYKLGKDLSERTTSSTCWPLRGCFENKAARNAKMRKCLVQMYRFCPARRKVRKDNHMG